MSYTVQQGYCRPGGDPEAEGDYIDLTSAATMAECQAKCTEDPSCAAVDFCETFIGCWGHRATAAGLPMGIGIAGCECHVKSAGTSTGFAMKSA